jgi:hypothetical protein
MRLVALFVCLVSLAWPRAAQAQGPLFALAIGWNAPPEAQPELSPLRYADDDAVRFHRLFAQAGAASTLLAELDAETARRHPELLGTTRAPTETTVARAFATLQAQVRASLARGEEPTVFIAYSGHGSLVGDEPGLSLRGGLLRRSRLHEALAALAPARVHVIVDACHAGSVVGARGGLSQALEPERVQLSEGDLERLWSTRSLARLSHVGAVLAAASAELTYEWSRIEAGLLSHEILSALSGVADVNEDGAVQYSELSAFLSAANQGIRDARAKPKVLVLPPGGNYSAVVFDVRSQRDARFVSAESARLGRFFVELDTGERLLDARLDAGAQVTLALPRQHDAFLVVGHREARIRKDGPRTLSLDELRLKPRQETARGAIDDALQKGWFASNYGRTYYEGFVDSQDIVAVPFAVPSDAAPRTTSSSRRLRLRRGLTWGAAGAVLAASAVTAGLSLEAKQDFDQNPYERRARELSERHRRTGYTALGLGGLGLGLVSFALVLELR